MQTLNIPREQLPQCRVDDKFIAWLTKNQVSFTKLEGTDLSQFKPSQEDFNPTKVDAIAANPGDAEKKPILVSNDRRVLDGHHRFLGLLKANRPGTIFMVNVPFPQLRALVTQYLADDSREINTGMKCFREWRETPLEPISEADRLFEAFMIEAAKDDPTTPGDVEIGDPGYVLRRLKSVPIHTQNTKPLRGTVNTAIGTRYDRIAPTSVAKLKKEEKDSEDHVGPTYDDEVQGMGVMGGLTEDADETDDKQKKSKVSKVVDANKKAKETTSGKKDKIDTDPKLDAWPGSPMVKV